VDLLDRYLHAVKFWLPKAQRQDIVSELSEDIRSQIEDKESELGRALTEAEIEATLVRIGRPVLVASRYLPQRHLIGPALFPIYVFVLKIVTACYLVPWILVGIGLLLYSPGYRAAHGGGWFRALGTIWGGFWMTALVAAGAVTAVFAALERGASKPEFLENWNPRRLPPVRDPNRIPRGTSILELAVNIVFASWWILFMSTPTVLNRPDIQITLAPGWIYFFWGYLILAAANIATAGANLLQPNWTRTTAGLRLVTNLCGSALFCVLCQSDILLTISLAVDGATNGQKIADAINMWASRALPFAAGVGLLVLAVDLRRLIRVKAA
jgi:hypothetical protein